MEARYWQNLQCSTHAALEDEGDDDRRGDGLSVKRGWIECPRFKRGDCLRCQ